MTLKDWIKQQGGQKPVSELLGVTQGTVSGWLCGRWQMPPETALRIHRLTNGQVPVTETRPDLDWSAITGEAA